MVAALQPNVKLRTAPSLLPLGSGPGPHKVDSLSLLLTGKRDTRQAGAQERGLEGEDRLSRQKPYSGTGTASQPPDCKVKACRSSVSLTPKFSVHGTHEAPGICWVSE